MIEVYAPGTMVVLDEDVEAKIVTVALHDDDVAAKLAAWRARQTDAVPEFPEAASED